MAIYDINGNEISAGGELTTADVKKGVIAAIASGDVNMGSAVGATLSYTSPGTAWETNAVTAYNNLLNAYREIPNIGVPFMIYTDQHNSGVEPMRWLNNHDADINGMGVMNLNLGDTCDADFNETVLSKLYDRTWQIKNYIGVLGNHDAINGNYYDLNRWFISTRGRKFYNGAMPCFTVEDNAHTVKYIAVGNYILGTDSNYSKGLTTDAAKWLIDELSANDGYDIVYLQHWGMYKSRRARNEETETTVDTARENANTSSNNYKMWQLLLARKNKESGTFEDADGVVHNFDFTDCEHELLITLHGHDHAELFSTVDGLTAYAADRCVNSRCTFGLIDRQNSKVTFWVFDKNGCLDPLELPI